jgi:two-component system OmpR family response regulator/two-component system response regulator QseB
MCAALPLLIERRATRTTTTEHRHMRILLAEDDPLLGDGLRAGLRQHGFQVDWVRDGAAAERELRAEPYAAAVLDLGLPLKDGLDVLSALRRAGIALPVLVLTARDAVADRVRGLDRGADDYVVKPVDLDELAARLRALVRRAHGQPQDVLRTSDVVLDPAARRVTRAGQDVLLAGREFDLLHALLLNAGRVMSREQLEQHLYSWGQEVESNAIEVHVHHLRRKLGAALVETVRGVGYVVRRDDGPAA